jgi:hypothetical protein
MKNYAQIDPSSLPVSKLIKQFSKAEDNITANIPKKRRSLLKLRTVGKMVNFFTNDKNNNNIPKKTMEEENNQVNEEKHQKISKLKSFFMNSSPIMRTSPDDGDESNLDSGKENNYDSGGEVNGTPPNQNVSNVQMKRNLYNNLKSNNKSILINENFARSRCSTLDVTAIKRPNLKNMTKNCTLDESSSYTTKNKSNLVDDRFAKYFGLNAALETSTQSKSNRRRSRSVPRAAGVNNSTKIDPTTTSTNQSQAADSKYAKYFGVQNGSATQKQRKACMSGQQPRRRSSTVQPMKLTHSNTIDISQTFLSKFEDFDLTPYDLSTADDEFNKLILGASLYLVVRKKRIKKYYR